MFYHAFICSIQCKLFATKLSLKTPRTMPVRVFVKIPWDGVLHSHDRVHHDHSIRNVPWSSCLLFTYENTCNFENQLTKIHIKLISSCGFEESWGWGLHLLSLADHNRYNDYCAKC